MALLPLPVLPRLLQLFRSILPDRLQQMVPSTVFLILDQRLLHERRQQVQHIIILDFGIWTVDWADRVKISWRSSHRSWRQSTVRTDGFRGFESPASGKDRQPPQECPFRAREQVIAPV